MNCKAKIRANTRGEPCWYCSGCNKKFQTGNLVNQHIRRVHGDK